MEIVEVGNEVRGPFGAHLAGVSAVVVSNNRIPTKDEGEILVKEVKEVVPETTRTAIPRKEANRQSFRVMTFNLRFYTERDGTNRWDFRKHLASATVRRHGADIVGFQEALRNQIRDLVASLPEYDWVGVGRDDGKEEGEYCPIFWRKDLFKSVDSGTFWLSETPDVAGSKGWGAGCRRIATWVRLVTIDDTRELFFLNSHFDHFSEQARLESSRLLSLRIPKLIAESNQRLSSTVTPSVVIVGDFNAEEDTMTLQLLRGEDRLHPGDADLTHLVFTDARLKARRKYNESDGSFTNWVPATLTEEAKRFILIDHILHHGELEPEQYGIVCELWQGRRASDHRPVITDYRFTNTTISR